MAEPTKKSLVSKETNRKKTARFKKLFKKIIRLLEENHAAFIALPNQETGIVDLRLLDKDDAAQYQEKLQGSIQEQLQDIIHSQGDPISAPADIEQKNDQENKEDKEKEKIN